MSTKYDSMVTDLVTELNGRQSGLEENEKYYEAEHRLKALGLSVPPEMRHLTAAVGWPRMYLDSVEERLDVEGFRNSDQPEGDSRLMDWWQANYLDVESGLGHIESMMHGEAYVTVSAPTEDENPDNPLIKVESPKNFIAKDDYRTRKVKEALRLYKNEDVPNEEYAALLLPDENVYLARNKSGDWKVDQIVRHELGRVCCARLLNRERLTERCGKSEISLEIRSATDAASRILMNMQAAAELMALPQRVIFGVSMEDFVQDPLNPGAAMEAYMARILAFENEGGKAMQFNAAELRNFVEALEEIAKLVASYTGLPPQYLSFSSENPASAEAIKSAESRLVKKAERKARMFGQAWEEAMRLGMLVIDGSIPDDAYKLETVWRDPSTPTFAAKADGVVKLAQAGILPIEQAREDLGYSDVQREQMRKWDSENPMGQLNTVLNAGFQADQAAAAQQARPTNNANR